MSPRPRPPSGNPPAPAARRAGLAVACALGLAALTATCAKGSGGALNGSGGSQGSSSGGVTGPGSGGASGSGSGGASSSGGASGSGGVSGAGTGGESSSGGASGAGSGGASGASSGGTMGGSGSGGTTPVNDAGMTDAACQMATVMFAPKIPNVLVLVDGSGSMFDKFTDKGGASTTRWDALKKAVLPIISSLQTQVDFGLAVFSGSIANKQCPIFKTVPIAANNSAAIAAAYPMRTTLDPNGGALETPLTMAMPMIPPLFATAKGDGGNYILLATDGEPDFCDNGNVTCPIDGVTYGLQQLAVKGMTTFVIGLTSDIVSSTCPGVLQAYANAGQNEAVANPCPGHTIGNECSGESHWMALATAAGGRTAGVALVDYTTAAGPAKVFTPDVADQASLTNTLAALFNGVKSCTFDLGNLGGQAIKVDLNQLGTAHVCLGKTCPDTTEVVQDATNGWSMATSTQLILNGTACDKWRMPNNNDISFDFPCKSIIFESTAPTRPKSPPPPPANQGRK